MGYLVLLIAVVMALVPTRWLGWSVAVAAICLSLVLTAAFVGDNLGGNFGGLEDTPDGKKVWVANYSQILTLFGVVTVGSLVVSAFFASVVLAFRRLAKGWPRT